MKKTFLLLLLVASSLLSHSQTNWLTKELGSGITVKFPINPTYQVKDKAGIYLAVTENNTFTVVVQYDVMPYYADFLKLAEKDQSNGVDVFLDNAVKELLKASGNESSTFHAIQIGNHKGRVCSYSSVNPATGGVAVYFIRMLYCFNKIYLFQCMQMIDDSTSSSERQIFFNSISKK